MKKISFLGVAVLLAAAFNSTYADPNCCYDPPVGKDDLVTKEYVDSKFAPVFQKLDSINARVDALSKELANMPKGSDPALASKVAALESAVNELKNSCPAECNAKLVSVEKNIAELKDKIEKRSQHLEKEVEKSMRK
ncbi:hypothetical protein [Sulfurihydrogenibium subterraneum]|uniref:hypothetical protein n=1 Tax=Sulfurihydrogenibium subterraneum TaxID=171121 RepID=UPI0004904DB3|nr:hypothetical protein [Sulfurihydrogenibium subterraneum]